MHAVDWKMVGWVGDSVAELSLHLHADGDFAGCPQTKRSTSGMHLALEGPHTRFPLQGQSKKQGCVSHSTPESEIVAADAVLRLEGFPATDLWSIIMQREPDLYFHEDSQAMIRVLMH